MPKHARAGQSAWFGPCWLSSRKPRLNFLGAFALLSFGINHGINQDIRLLLCTIKPP